MSGRRAILYGLALIAIILLAVAPVVLALSASAIAEAHGCRLDEGGVHPCQAFGGDMGETLNLMFVSHWLGLLTLPAGAVLAAVWLVALIVDLVRLSVARRRASSGPS